MLSRVLSLLLALGALVGTRALATDCSPCENGQEYCGDYDYGRAQWTSGAWQSCAETPPPPARPSPLEECCQYAGGLWQSGAGYCSRPFGACAGDCRRYEAEKEQYNCESRCRRWSWTDGVSGQCN